jgi:hypothetical protein
VYFKSLEGLFRAIGAGLFAFEVDGDPVKRAKRELILYLAAQGQKS